MAVHRQDPLDVSIDKIYRSLPIIRELFQIRDSLRHRLLMLQMAEFLKTWELGLEQHPRYSQPLRLQRHSFQVNSQSGEDGIIREIFRRIGTGNRVFVELGVGDGLENNTAFLLSQGWRGYWIDGSGDFLRTLSSKRLGPERVQGRAASITRENATSLLKELGVPDEFDLLSIDIDQNTYYVWEALRGYRPRLAAIEYNAALPPDLDWKVVYDANRLWDGTVNFGASLKALENLGRELGYSLVGCDLAGTNAFFVRNDLVGDHFAAPFTAENHYEPVRYALLQTRGHARTILDNGGS